MGILGGMLGGLISAGGSIGTSLINALAQKEANQTAVDLANTSVQRRVKDLEAAGLNPVLAAGQGAANPTPEAIKVSNPVEAAMQGAMTETNVAMTESQQRLLAETVKEKGIQNLKAEAELPYAAKMAELAWKIKVSDQFKASQSEIPAALAADYAYWEKMHVNEFSELRLKAAREKWTQQQLETKEIELRNALLKSDAKFRDTLNSTGVLGQAVGTFAKILQMSK